MYKGPPNLLKAIALLSEDTKARIITSDEETDFFHLTAGILQRDSFAPYLFVLLFDYVMHKTLNEREEDVSFILERRRSKRVAPKILTTLDSADGIALISEEIHQTQEVLLSIQLETWVSTVIWTRMGIRN